MTRLERISNYYSQIDANDINAILELFDEAATYDRADKSYRGKPRIEQFFRHERLIRGIHVVESIWEVPSSIVAVGVFQGVGENGDPRLIGFTDIWRFDERNLVNWRRTYLATGHEIVER